jgi:hypothetical protein
MYSCSIITGLAGDYFIEECRGARFSKEVLSGDFIEKVFILHWLPLETLTIPLNIDETWVTVGDSLLHNVKLQSICLLTWFWRPESDPTLLGPSSPFLDPVTFDPGKSQSATVTFQLDPTATLRSN